MSQNRTSSAASIRSRASEPLPIESVIGHGAGREIPPHQTALESASDVGASASTQSPSRFINLRSGELRRGQYVPRARSSRGRGTGPTSAVQQPGGAALHSGTSPVSSSQDGEGSVDPEWPEEATQVETENIALQSQDETNFIVLLLPILTRIRRSRYFLRP
ncbi:hypothetical protein EXIGLDRAFT_122471 [Exidia glandulosa HHB12029]|uniref:Uncharacterized protein n=1 Tax=Exidia glandulosa HHB12029 TaxID=1314781 RepID=A0A166BG78_EXIGL|nr:hypothetical protein EXIGLDRAFT_122471 [Exidia glandulosa HHB12029]